MKASEFVAKINVKGWSIRQPEGAAVYGDDDSFVVQPVRPDGKLGVMDSRSNPPWRSLPFDTIMYVQNKTEDELIHSVFAKMQAVLDHELREFFLYESGDARGNRPFDPHRHYNYDVHRIFRRFSEGEFVLDRPWGEGITSPLYRPIEKRF